MDIFLAILFILICILLIGVILLQKGRGGGLSGAFGGVGGHSAFGSRTGDMFTWITVVLVALFLLITTVTVWRYRPPDEPVTTARPTEIPAAAPATATAPAPATAPADVETPPAADPTEAPVDEDEASN